MLRRTFLLAPSCLTALGQTRLRPGVYFVPVGDAPVADIPELIQHFKSRLSLEIGVLPAMKIPPEDRVPNRKQTMAEPLLESMVKAYRGSLVSSPAVLIGLTDEDLFVLTEDWTFCFGAKNYTLRAGLISASRMNLHYRMEPFEEGTRIKRLQKYVMRYIGVLHYRLPDSADPKSPMYRNVMSLQDLDRMREKY